MREIDIDDELLTEAENVEDFDEEELLDDDELDSRSAAFLNGYRASF